MKLIELSPRRRQILDLVAAGKTDSEIAQLLDISVKTVGGTLAGLYDEVGAHNRISLVRHFFDLQPIE